MITAPVPPSQPLACHRVHLAAKHASKLVVGEGALVASVMPTPPSDTREAR